ncbi:MAG: hypothetical protein ACLTCB_07695, partial [Merdibacter sp.]
VLGMPPAFILSQDQTLHLLIFFLTLARLVSLFALLYSLLGIDVSCSVFKDRFPRLAAPPLSARLYYHPLPFPSSIFLFFFAFFRLFDQTGAQPRSGPRRWSINFPPSVMNG